MNVRTVGLIGTDSSHAIAFTELLNDTGSPLHVPGYRVVSAWPGGSPDFALSASRAGSLMDRLEAEHGVARSDTPEAVAASCDALMLLSIDGRERTSLFSRIAPFGKPVFIDKPLAISARGADEIAAISKAGRSPIFSVSALRYAVADACERADVSGLQIQEATVRGPLQIEPTQSVYYWYGIHLAEMLFALLGRDCISVRTERLESCDRLIGVWRDGRTGTAVCDRSGGYAYEATVRIDGREIPLPLESDMRKNYARLVADAALFFDTGVSPVAIRDTLAIVRFLQAAEKSLERGGTPVALAD